MVNRFRFIPLRRRRSLGVGVDEVFRESHGGRLLYSLLSDVLDIAMRKPQWSLHGISPRNADMEPLSRTSQEMSEGEIKQYALRSQRGN